jgi:RNA polymerase sigma factor (sigma-70 family)
MSAQIGLLAIDQRAAEWRSRALGLAVLRRLACNAPDVIPHLTDVSASKAHRPVSPAAGSSPLEFGMVYRENVDAVTGFFARRCTEPQVVADLTSQTFVEAIASAHTFAGRGTPRAWLIAIARATYAQHCASLADREQLVDRLGARRLMLDEDEIDDLAERIDAHREGRVLLERAAQLSELDRATLELVHLVGLTPSEAARTLGISAGALRVRLFRARNRLRKEGINGNV